MDYNARMSQQFRQTQTGRHGASAGVGKQTKARKEEADDPMRLDDREIAGCISDVGMPGFGVEDLQQPAPALIQRVFEWFAELLTNTTRETVEPAMREAARDVCGDDMLDLVPPDARNLLGFFASLRKILVKGGGRMNRLTATPPNLGGGGKKQCGIDDLTFADLLRPTYPRLVRIFSYIINFVRFREDQTSAIDRHFGLVESTKHGIETLYASNAELQSRLEHLRLQRVNQESANREKTARNSALKERLLELKKAQEKVALDMERVRRTKAELTASLAAKTERTLSLQKECDRLSPYASQSSAALQAQLNELSAALAREKALAEAASRRHRALHTSSAAFSAAAGDVAALLPLLDATYAAAADERAEELEAQKRREALGERGQDVRE
ncbi:MAG: hypothetical protein LQ340_006959, partial [Diploschistes diacapsis]